MMKRFVSFTLLSLAIVACTTVPITGRSQLLIFSDAEMVQLADAHHAEFMSRVRDRGLVYSAADSPNAAWVIESITRAAFRVVDATGLRGQLDWDVTIVKAANVNAFVRPNGKIVVYTGLFRVADTEPLVAAVLGHEVAHVVARHAAERLSQQLVARTRMQHPNAFPALSAPKYRPIVGAAFGYGAQYGVSLPYSHEHELEADRLGLTYMAKAGYDPDEGVKVWERLEAAVPARRSEFLSTHPSPTKRREQISRWLPEARRHFQSEVGR